MRSVRSGLRREDLSVLLAQGGLAWGAGEGVRVSVSEESSGPRLKQTQLVLTREQKVDPGSGWTQVTGEWWLTAVGGQCDPVPGGCLCSRLSRHHAACLAQEASEAQSDGLPWSHSTEQLSWHQCTGSWFQMAIPLKGSHPGCRGGADGSPSTERVADSRA